MLDMAITQQYNCVMIPEFQPDGNLPPGIHFATWGELVARFGHTPWRRRLLTGLQEALEQLRSAGCRTVYIDGSFVSDKQTPGDFDGCWEEAGVIYDILDPVLLTFDQQRATQKAKYGGELFPATGFLEFFQIDKERGTPKGIIALDLGGLT